jgi:uncharacterized protein (TIGR02246 family)
MQAKHGVETIENAPIIKLYRDLHDAWNQHSAANFALLFTDDGMTIGFDGSEMIGKAQIEEELSAIFADHVTAAYIGIVRDVRFLADNIALLHAVAGMVPPGGSDINPAANSIQTLTAVRENDQWRIALFQNTPAQYHGRPQLTEFLNTELRQVLKSQHK